MTALVKYLQSFCLIAALSGSSVVAETADDSLRPGGDPMQRVPLALVVNGVSKGDIVVLVVGFDVLVRADDLTAAGVAVAPETPIAYTLRSDQYVSLLGFAPHLNFRVVNETATLELTADPTLLAHTNIAIGARSLDETTAAVPSAFLSYQLTDDSEGGSGGGTANSLSGYAQLSASTNAGLFTASGSLEEGALRRGLIALEIESEARLRRITFGDSFAATSPLGGTSVVGGIGVARHFEFAPDYAYYQTAGITGTTLTPATAEVYVNGSLVRSVQLFPGAFSLNNLTNVTGAGVTNVVLRDQDGNTTTLAGSFYESRAVLLKGVTDYEYHLGFLRRSPFSSTDTYGPFAEFGAYRLGVTNALTLGGRIEHYGSAVSGGPSVDLGTPLGHFSVELGRSAESGSAGSTGAVAYDYATRRFSIGLSAFEQSLTYSDSSLLPTDPRTRSSVRGSLGLLSPLGILSLTEITSSFSSAPNSSQVILSDAVTVTRRDVALVITAQRNSGGSVFGGSGQRGGSWGIGVSLQAGVGHDMQVSTDVQGGADAGAHIDIQKSPTIGPGIGYEVGLTGGVNGGSAEQFEYHGAYGDATLDSSTGSSGRSTSITIAGGAAAYRQGVFFTRPLAGAYALAVVPGFPGTPIYLGSTFEGTTDRRGAVAVPDLDPYFANSLSVGIDDARLDLTVDAVSATVRPRLQTGAIHTFRVREFHAYSGEVAILLGGATTVPAFGQLLVHGAHGEQALDLGSRGQFYIDDLSPGQYSAELTTVTGLVCRFTLEVPPPAGLVTQLARQTCIAPI